MTRKEHLYIFHLDKIDKKMAISHIESNWQCSQLSKSWKSKSPPNYFKRKNHARINLGPEARLTKKAIYIKRKNMLLYNWHPSNRARALILSVPSLRIFKNHKNKYIVSLVIYRKMNFPLREMKSSWFGWNSQSIVPKFMRCLLSS